MKNYACIDIGGTSIKYSVIDNNLNFAEKGELDTDAYLGGASIVEKVKSIIRRFQKQYILSGICISTAGMVGKNGQIFYSCDLIPNYTGTELKKIIEAEFLLPCEVENDVNCAGLAETLMGAGRNSPVNLCLTIGTGVGGCIIIDNKIFHGYSFSACEVGYMNIGNGMFQDLAAASKLSENVAKRKNCEASRITGKFIFEQAKSGDKDCIEEIDNLVNSLAAGIANICYVINPKVVILGGGIMAQKEYLEDKINFALKNTLIPIIYENTEIRFAENGNNAGMLGAFFNFKQKQNI